MGALVNRCNDGEEFLDVYRASPLNIVREVNKETGRLVFLLDTHAYSVP